MSVRLWAVAIGIALVGCAASPSEKTTRADAGSTQEPLPAPVATLPMQDTGRFDYELLRREDTQLAEVFDDTQKTYLVFTAQVPAGLLLFDERGRMLPFTAKERTAVVDAVRPGILVRTPTQSSYAEAAKAAVVARLGKGGASEDGNSPRPPIDVAAARAEILHAEDRLKGLTAELGRASRGEPSLPLTSLRAEIEEIQVTLDGADATLVRAHFATGSAMLALSAEAKQAIVDAAGRADSVRIRGGVDNLGTAAANVVLARRRGLSMRRVLIDGGVAARKVRLDRALPSYIASNDTPEGRAENRRVDVVFAVREGHQSPRERINLGEVRSDPVIQ